MSQGNWGQQPGQGQWGQPQQPQQPQQQGWPGQQPAYGQPGARAPQGYPPAYPQPGAQQPGYQQMPPQYAGQQGPYPGQQPAYPGAPYQGYGHAPAARKAPIVTSIAAIAVGALALLGLLLPWVSIDAMFGSNAQSYSGFSIIGNSDQSPAGQDGQLTVAMSWVGLIAAIVLAILGVVALILRRLPTGLRIGIIVAGIITLVSAVVVIIDYLGTFADLPAEYQSYISMGFGVWLFLGGLILGVVPAIGAATRKF